ncbi:MAG TPA: PAS domain S-box protein [Bacteroidota bacterium]|nr:PAS domain S-box protein [Bacteroidota bacterium]
MDDVRPPLFASENSLRTVLVDRLLPLLTAGFWIFAVASLGRLEMTGIRPFVVIDAVILCGITMVWLMRRRMTVEQKGLAISASLSLLFVAGVFTFGLLSAALLLPPAISLFLAAMGHRRLSLFSVWIALFLIILAGWLFTRGVLQPPLDASAYLVSPAAWVLWIVALGTVAIAFSLPLRLIPLALEERDARARAAFENAAEGVCLLDARGRFLDVNPAFCAMLGYGHGELVGRDVSSVTHPGDIGIGDAVIARALAGEHVQSTFDKRFLTKAGVPVWARVSAVLVRESSAGESYFVSHVQDLTDQRATDAALRESELKYRTLFDSASDAIFLMNDGVFVDCNRKTLDMFGAPADGILGRTPQDFSPPVQPDGTPSDEKARALIRAALGGTPQRFEWRHARADGSEFDAEVMLNRLGPAAGSPDLLAIVRDITERKREERALRESEEKFEKIFHVSPAPMSISRLRDGVYVDVNESFMQAMGYRREELIGSSAVAIGAWADPGDRERMAAMLRESGSVRNLEARHQTKSGEIGYSIASAEILDLNGEKHILGVTLDITERKNAEDALRLSETRYRALVENTPDIIARFDPECRYLFVNSAIHSVSPIPSREFVGKRLTEVGFTPGQAAEREEMVRRVFASGDPIEAELTFETHGRLQTYEWRAFPEFDDARTVRSVLAMNRNITVRKEAERSLHASMEQLHALARRMERVREEERKAISHEVHDELGQILTALRMDLMGLRGLRPAQAILFEEKVRSMLDLTDHAIESVQGISARLRPGMLDYLGLLAAMEWQAEEFQKRSGVKVSLALPGEEPALDGEEATALFRIFQETLTNVARHARASAVAVSLADQGGALVMIVADNGVGIAAGKINDPSSLGLLGMRERLHPFGGTCTIENPPEGGTRVTIRLPRTTARDGSNEDTHTDS